MKALVIDIETYPHRGRHWGLFDQNIGLSQLDKVTKMGSFAAKWATDPKTMFFSEWQDGQEGMARAVRWLLNQADVVIHFNGTTFDEPHIRREIQEQRQATGEFLAFAPPSPFQVIDVLREVRWAFKNASNKLEYILKWLGLDGKVQHQGFGLWRAVEEGDPVARRLFRKYNIGDVVQLEKAYDDTKVWYRNHPNMQLFVPTNGEDDKGNPIVTEDTCVLCGTQGAVQFGTNPRGRLSRVARYNCHECGKIFSGKKSVKLALGR